jgi:hypothetical protein
MNQTKRQDLIDYFKVNTKLKSWYLSALQDAFHITTLAFLLKKEKETVFKTGSKVVSMTFMEFERESFISLSKLRRTMEFFKECNLGELTLASDTGGTKEFKWTFNSDDVWFTTGSIKRPMETQIFTEILFPDVLWTDATLAPFTPLNKLVLVYLIQNLNYENGYTDIVREEPLRSMTSRSKYGIALNDFVKSNVTEEITNRVPRKGQGYRTFIIKNPTFWGNEVFESKAHANIKALQNAVFDFDEKKALQDRSAEARALALEIGKRYLKNVLSIDNHETYIEDRDLEVLATFYDRGLTDGFDYANSIMDKIFAGESITRDELAEAIKDVCKDDPVTFQAKMAEPARKAIIAAQARQRLKRIAPNLLPHEIDAQLDFYRQNGRFNLDVNFQFNKRPTLTAPVLKKRSSYKKKGKEKVTPSATAQAKLLKVKEAREKKNTPAIIAEKVIDPTVATQQIERATQAAQEAPKKSYITPVDEPKKEIESAPVSRPMTKGESGMITAVKFPFCLVQRIRNEKDLEKLRNFVPSLEDLKEADRQVKANAELAQEFCEEIGRQDIIEKYYFSSTDMAKFHSILNFFRKDAHIWPLDDLEFYLKNYDDFDWWAITQDGMPKYKHLM